MERSNNGCSQHTKRKLLDCFGGWGVARRNAVTTTVVTRFVAPEYCGPHDSNVNVVLKQ